MADIQHEDLQSIHRFAYVDSADPGAVGAYKAWIDTTLSPLLVLKIRNQPNADWLTIGIIDQDLIDIAALSPSNNDLLQRKAGAWINRTLAQVKSDLALDLVPNVDARARATHTGTQLADTISDFTASVLSAVAGGGYGAGYPRPVVYRYYWDLANHVLTSFTLADIPVDTRLIMEELIIEHKNFDTADAVDASFYINTDFESRLFNWNDFRDDIPEVWNRVSLPLDNMTSNIDVTIDINDYVVDGEVNLYIKGILQDHGFDE